MTPDNLPEDLHAWASRSPARDADCPSEMDIAAYVDGELSGPEHERLQLHLADCSSCLSLVALLSRERNAAPDANVPGETIAQVAELKVARGPKGTWARVQPWAMAASLVLIVPMLAFLGQRADGPDAESTSAVTRTLRTSAAAGSPLQVISPAPGMEVSRRSLDFRWSAVPGSPFYDVRIVSDDGELIAAERIRGTDWRPPADLPLLPGNAYYLHVDAYPTGDKALSSEHFAFQVRD